MEQHRGCPLLLAHDSSESLAAHACPRRLHWGVRRYGKNGTYGSYIYEPEGRRIVEAHDPKEPLFIYMALQVMHAPQEVPTEFSDLYPQPKYDMDYAIM